MASSLFTSREVFRKYQRIAIKMIRMIGRGINIYGLPAAAMVRIAIKRINSYKKRKNKQNQSRVLARNYYSQLNIPGKSVATNHPEIPCL